jgi:hypothetical protein
LIANSCQTAAKSPFVGTVSAAPACSGSVTTAQATLLQTLFNVAPAPIKQQLCALGEFYIGPSGMASWGQHWGGTPYIGVSQDFFSPSMTLLAALNGKVAGFWNSASSTVYSGAAAASNTSPGPEWAMLAEVAHEVGHWIDPYDRAGTKTCQPSYPVGACDLDPHSFFVDSWTYYVPLPPNYAFAEAHPWGIALRPAVLQARSDLQQRISPASLYDELFAPCTVNSGKPGMGGEFPSWFALTAPTEHFAESLMFFSLWKAGLTSLTIQGVSTSYNLVAVMFSPQPNPSSGHACGFGNKMNLLEAYWQAMPQ